MAKLIERTQVGKREDLRDVISVVDAHETPFVSMAKKGKAPANTVVEWQADSIPKPKYDGTKDGEDVKVHENMAAGRAMLQGRIQVYDRTPMVGFIAEQVSNVAGIGKKGEMARSIATAIVAEKRDIECSFCSDRDSRPETDTQASWTRGMGSWISNSAQNDLPVPEAYRTPAASINTTTVANLTEDNVIAVAESLWLQTGSKGMRTLLCGSTLKRRFSSYTRVATGSTNVMSVIRTFTQQAESRKIINTVDVYETDFGPWELILSNFLAQDSGSAAVMGARGYVLDFDLINTGWVQVCGREPLSNGGGGKRELVRSIALVEPENPLAFGKFAATS